MATKASRYGITARDYLLRAQRQARKKDQASLFYVAFELRCGIEARMQEYLEPQTHLSKKQRTQWRINKMGGVIAEAFALDDKIQRIAIRSPDGRDIAAISYVPVSKRLQTIGGKLGDYLHAQESFSGMTESWWRRFRDLVDEGCRLLERAVGGELYGPFLTNHKMLLEAPSGLRNQLKPGVKFTLSVSYEDF